MRSARLPLAALAAALLLSGRAAAGAAPEVPKVAGTSEEDKARWLAAEKPEQKKLREELAALAKAGQKLYYNSDFEGKHQRIYAVAPDGSGFAHLAGDDQHNAEYPRVSADGQRLVFVCHTRQLSKEEFLKLPLDPRYDPNQWQKGGARLKGALIWMMNLDGSDLHPVAQGAMPAWSADGRYLAYGVQPRPNVRRLGLQDLEKKQEWVFEARGGNSPCFTPDGKYYVGGAHYIESFKIADIIAGESKPRGVFLSSGCNNEMSPDGKWLVHVLDSKTGSWISYYPFDPEKKTRSESANLGVPRETMNYFPEVSPDNKYMAWAHWKTTEAWKTRGANRYAAADAELYVTRWPPDGVSVRITWHGGTTQNPEWWAPPPAAGAAQ